MISCEKATKICNKTQYHEASILERFQLWWHLMICKICAQFSKENSKLTGLCKEAHLEVLPPDKKQKIKKRVLEELSN